MTERVYLGIDVGTQSVRVLAVRGDGSLAASASEPLRSTRDGVRHEQQPEEWWQAVRLCCRAVTSEMGAGAEVAGLAVDATSGTILLVDERGNPLTPGLMYDDGRAREEAVLVNVAGAALWSQLSYRMQPSWALPKLLWLVRQGHAAPGARLAHQNDFIQARLAGTLLASDSSNSLKTGYDLLQGCWPDAVFDRLGLPPELFPPVVQPGRVIGEVSARVAGETGLPLGTPIVSGMTDSCAAQMAAGATTPGAWHTVIGTTLVLKGVTAELLRDPLGVVYSHRAADGVWLPGGASSTGAGAIAAEFAVGALDMLNREARRAGPTPLVVYPLVGQGERYPFAAPEAVGFTLGQAASPVERFTAVLQGIAFVERLAFDALALLGADVSGRRTTSGGAVRSDALNQIRADVLGRELGIPANTESAFGMAMLAASRETSMTEAAGSMARMERTIAPDVGFAPYAEQYRRFIRELAARGWLPWELADATLARAAA